MCDLEGAAKIQTVVHVLVISLLPSAAAAAADTETSFERQKKKLVKKEEEEKADLERFEERRRYQGVPIVLKSGSSNLA